MSGGNHAALAGMTFLEFMAKLNREIERMEREIEQAKRQAQALKNHGIRK